MVEPEQFTLGHRPAVGGPDRRAAGLAHRARARRIVKDRTERCGDGGRVGRINDEPAAVEAQFHPAVEGLKDAAAQLQSQGTTPFMPPLRWDDAGWVANRWCELLPVAMSAKQRLMELEDPVTRLRLVDEFLRSRQVLKD